MKQAGLVKGAGFLAGSLFISKIIGAFYRIPLTNILGAEGMGLYQLVYPVFTLFLVLTSGAVPTAISILVSKSAVKNEQGKAEKFFTSTFLLLSVIGVVSTLLMVALSGVIASLQANETAKYGYVALAPSVLLVGLLSVYRGWFLGKRQITLNGLSQIFESVTKLCVGLALARFMLRYGLEYAVMGALFGVTFGELTALILVAVIAAVKKEKPFTSLTKDEFSLTVKEVALLCLPLVLSGMILPFSQFADSFLVVNLLNKGSGIAGATSAYGIYTGPVGSLINMPVSVCLALGAMITPMVSGDMEERRLMAIKEKADTGVKLSLIVGLPFFLAFVFFGGEILRFLYPKLSNYDINVGMNLLRIEAINVLTLAFFQIYSSILQGLGKTYVPVKILSVCVVVKLLLNVILLPKMGINGAAIASVVCFSLAFVCDAVYYIRLVGKSKSMLKNASLILLSGAIMTVLYFGFSFLFVERWILFAVAAAGFVVYFFCLFALKVFTKAELNGLPLSKLWLKLDGFFRIRKETR